MSASGKVTLWTTSIPATRSAVHLTRCLRRTRAVNRSSEPFAADSPLSVITHDLDYLEKTFGIRLHGGLDIVREAHDQVTLIEEVGNESAG